MTSAISTVFFIGMINPMKQQTLYWNSYLSQGTDKAQLCNFGMHTPLDGVGFLRLPLDSGCSRRAHFYFLQPRSPALKAPSTNLWFMESFRHTGAYFGTPMCGGAGCRRCAHSLRAHTGCGVQHKHPFRVWDVKWAVALG